MRIYKNPFLSNCDAVLLGKCFLTVRTQRHGVTCQNNWTLNHTAAKASNLTCVSSYLQQTASNVYIELICTYKIRFHFLYTHIYVLRYSTNVVWLHFLVPFVAYFTVYSRPIL